MKSFKLYRIEHMTHHKHLGTYESDMDFKNIEGLKLEDKLTPKVVFRHVLTPFTGLHIRHYFGLELSLKDGFSIFIFKLILISAALILTWFEPLATLLFLVVPFVWIYSAINYWTDCIDHGGLLGGEDDSTQSRDFIVSRWIRVIFFPRNDCFHLTHHLFPSVPVEHFLFCHDHIFIENNTYKSHQLA